MCKFLGLSSSSFATSSLIIKALLKTFLKYYIPYLFCPSSLFAVEILNSVSNMSLKWLQGFQLRSVSRACLCNTMQISSFNSVSINYAFLQENGSSPFYLSICVVKKIARIAKAALHKLPGKSSLNIRSVCPASPLHLSVLSVSPVPSVPVVLSVVMTMTTILSVIPVLSEQTVVIPSRGSCPRSTQLTYLKVLMVIFVRKLKVVHKQVGGYLISYNLHLAYVRSWRLSDQMNAL